MKLVRPITKHEMLRKWAIGELDSQFFNPSGKEQKEETLAMLTSEVISEEVEGINLVLSLKQDLVASLPPDLKWYIAMLTLNKKEMDLIYTMQGEGWEQYSKGSYQLSSAARNLNNHTFRDERIENIINALRNNSIELSGITLVAEGIQGPYFAIEGNGRLTGLYILNLLEENSESLYGEIAITLGIYDENN